MSKFDDARLLKMRMNHVKRFSKGGSEFGKPRPNPRRLDLTMGFQLYEKADAIDFLTAIECHAQREDSHFYPDEATLTLPFDRNFYRVRWSECLPRPHEIYIVENGITPEEFESEYHQTLFKLQYGHKIAGGQS